MTFEKKEPEPLLLKLGILAASGVGVSVLVLIIAFSRGCDFWGSSPASPSVAFQKRSEKAAPRTAASPAAQTSSADTLPWMSQEADPAYAHEGDSAKPAETASAAPAPASASSSSTAAPARGPLAMSAEEEAAVKANGFGSLLLAARASEDNARAIFGKLGNKQAMLMSLWAKFMGYPKLIGLIANNDYVINGFMSRPDVRQRCDDAGSLTNYLSNTKDPSGISAAMPDFNAALNTPGGTSASVIFGSKLVNTVLSQCGAVNAVTHDPAAIKAIAISNPALPAMLADPRLITALSANSAAAAAMSTLTTAQTSMSLPSSP